MAPPARSLPQEQLATEAISSLEGPGSSVSDAIQTVPDDRGLYAIYGARSVWTELGLGIPPDGRPLYVGKAEESLVSRDIKQHFGSGQTGRSTLRRSVAALLHDALSLRGQPRNVARPADFDRFALNPVDEERLTAWMTAHLTIATWSPSIETSLRHVEALVVRALVPPLNLTLVTTMWTGMVKRKRAEMAAEARSWGNASGL